jgi:hypothetical protein
MKVESELKLIIHIQSQIQNYDKTVTSTSLLTKKQGNCHTQCMAKLSGTVQITERARIEQLINA